MANVSELIQNLRAQTGAGVLDIKKALDETDNDEEKAVEILRKRGQDVAAKKAGRSTSQGVIMSYIHMDKIGTMVEVNCETDFVARNEEFKALAKDIAMQIASMNPLYISEEDVPAEVVAKEREIYAEQTDKDLDQKVKDQIVEGKLKKYFKEVCLLNQLYFKDEDKTIQDVLTEAIGKIGENIQIRRFCRFALDDNDKCNGAG
ncbi:MAG: translation elongation factor Ts [Candidatus Kerfeldbacteria bacterium]